VGWARRAGTRDFCPFLLTGVVGQVQSIIFSPNTISFYLSPFAHQAGPASRAASPIDKYVSLGVILPCYPHNPFYKLASLQIFNDYIYVHLYEGGQYENSDAILFSTCDYCKLYCTYIVGHSTININIREA
jgi:hypothetical protein